MELRFPSGTRFTVTPSGKDIYAIGGDQRLSPASLEQLLGRAPDGRRYEFLGVIKRLDYTSKKRRDGFEDKPYTHSVGEETLVGPVAIYDTERPQVLIMGGNFNVDDWMYD